MATRRLIETATRLIQECIETNIVSALTDIRTDRPDQSVSTEPFKSYFIYPTAAGYQTPACFIVSDNIDLLREDKAANFICAKIRFYIAAVIEDRREKELTIKSWRYQAALHEILENTQLTDADEKVKLVVIVKRATFSGIEGRQNSQSSDKVFRREVVLECDVEHWEASS